MLRVIHIGTLAIPLFDNDTDYRVAFVDGLDPVAAEVSTSPYALLDGESHLSSRVGMRNIVLTLELHPSTRSIAESRSELYRLAAPGKTVELRFLTDRGDRRISAVVETFEAPLFVRNPQVQISFLCPLPHFYSPSQITHTFASAVDGMMIIDPVEGDVPVGFWAEFKTVTTATSLAWWNNFDGPNMTFRIENVHIGAATNVLLSSIPFEKNISAGNNKFMAQMTMDSVWPRLVPGRNVIYATFTNIGGSNEFPTDITIRYNPRYVGL